jgi:hypothetical protein
MVRTVSRRAAVQLLVGTVVVYAICCQPAATPAVISPAVTGPAFSGIVRDSITPAPGVSITLLRESSILATAVSDKAGRFTFGPQRDGDYKFSISSSKYAPCSIDVSFSPGQRDVLIGVVPASDSARLRRQRAASGSYCSCRIPLTKPTSLKVPASRATLPPPAGSRATLAFDVLDPYDGDGVYQAQVVLSPDPSAGQEQIWALTDVTGRAVFQSLAPGKYRVLVRRIGFVATRTEVVAVAGVIDSLSLPFKWDASQLCLMIRTGR